MAGDKELEAGLRRMAEDFHLPGGGRMKLSRLVAEHLGWFAVAERRGLGWQDMIRVLTAVGVVGRTESTSALAQCHRRSGVSAKR